MSWFAKSLWTVLSGVYFWQGKIRVCLPCLGLTIFFPCWHYFLLCSLSLFFVLFFFVRASLTHWRWAWNDPRASEKMVRIYCLKEDKLFLKCNKCVRNVRAYEIIMHLQNSQSSLIDLLAGGFDPRSSLPFCFFGILLGRRISILFFVLP